MNAPPHFKRWVPVLKRADELDLESTTDPDLGIVAFYCRKHVVEQASRSIPNPMGDVFLMHLLDELGHKKAQLGVSQEQGKTVCSNHALLLFAKAVRQKDTEEAALGRASKTTAKLFYNASTLLDMLTQFDDAVVDPEMENKRKYAKLQAIEIAKSSGPGAVGGGLAVAVAPPPPAPAASAPLAPAPTAALPVAPPAAAPAFIAAPAAAVAAPAQLVAALGQGQQPPFASANTSSTGFAESCRLIQSCVASLVEGDNINAARDHLDACVQLRCANTRVKDAIELCAFAIATKSSGRDAAKIAKTNKLIADAQRRLTSA